jgi:osmoprotectant transport system permease protein
MKEQLALLPEYLSAHLRLSLFALLLGTCISLPLGIAVTRHKRLEQPLLLVASTIQTVPSLALLALMVPLLASLGLPSIGYLPAFIALVLYSLLPILRNAVTGLSTLDPAVIEAAQAVGMTAGQQLFRVELPLALPVIVAGIRTAAVWTVGMATLSTPVGGVSLGNYIFSGLQTRNFDAVIVGCVSAAAFALLLDTLARLMSLGLERGKRWTGRVAAAGFAALYLYAGGTVALGALSKEPRAVAIGAKTFTEQYILSEIVAQRIAKVSGLATQAKQSLGSTVVFDALASGEVDVYVDYSGTIWATIMHRSDVPSRDTVLLETKRYLMNKYGIRLVGALGFENAYALALRREQALELGVSRISDLVARAPLMSMGADYEFFQRREWKAIATKYGLRFQRERSMDPSLMYAAVASRSVDVISAFSSDGRIAAFDLTVLTDDLHAIPPYDAIILAGKHLAESEPTAMRALESLVGRIDGDAMRRMNLSVDQGKLSPRDVARAFLAELR